jgi:hypothetical protein
MTLFSTSEFAQEFSMAKNPRDATQAMTRFFQETRFPYTEILPSLEDTFSIYIQAMGKMVYELVATSNDSNALIDKLKTLKKEYIGAEFCVVNPHTKTSVFVKN